MVTEPIEGSFSFALNTPFAYQKGMPKPSKCMPTPRQHYAYTMPKLFHPHLRGLFSKTPAKTIFYFYSVYLSLDMLMYYIDNLLRIGVQLRHHIGNNINIQMMNMVSRVLVSLL